MEKYSFAGVLIALYQIITLKDIFLVAPLVCSIIGVIIIIFISGAIAVFLDNIDEQNYGDHR